MTIGDVIGRIVKPLASRKIRVALATIIAVFAAEWGCDLNTEGVATVIATIVSLSAVILGIAIEDAGEKAGGNPSTSSG